MNPDSEEYVERETLRHRVSELEQAIRRIAVEDATLSVCDGNVTVTIDGLRITDAEREALAWAEAAAANAQHPAESVLRTLRERHAP